MKIILAITLGTRDIQVKLSALEANGWMLDQTSKVKEVKQSSPGGLAFPGYLPEGFNDTFCFSQPRVAGRQILEHYDSIVPILHFPLLQPAVDFLVLGNNRPDFLFLLCTDQQEEFEAGKVKPKDYNNDTLYFAEVVAKYLQQYLQLDAKQTEIYKVSRSVTDMDYLYTHFAAQGSRLFSSLDAEIEKIYLLPQGGIDHINQAFTLKLIQQFGEKVMQLQQAEGQEPRQLSFPRLFLNDLYRQRRLQHLYDFEFGLLAQSINTSYKQLAVVRRLSLWADAKLHQRFNLLPDIITQITPRLQKNDPELLGWLQLESQDTPLLRLQALTAMCKIQWLQRNITDMLWRLFTLAENLFKVLLEQILNWPDTDAFYRLGSTEAKNEAWENFLGEEYVRLLHEKEIYVSNPNRRAYQELYLYNLRGRPEYQQVQNICAVINALAGKRNKLAHYLKPVHEKEVNEVLQVYGWDVPAFLNNVATLINMPSPDFAEKLQSYLETQLR